MGVDVVSTAKSNNKMKGIGGSGDYQLPYPMKHLLEIEEWVSLFQPQGLYPAVKDEISSVGPSVSEGEEAVCEACNEVHPIGFSDYSEYFTEEEYERIISFSRACSLDCAIQHVFRRDYAPSVTEFKSNPEEYKTTGLVNYTVGDTVRTPK
jgi:hypothetical protein